MAHPKTQRPQAAQGTFHPSPTSTTAAFHAIRCRCGTAHPMPQRPQAAQRTFHPSPTSTTAAFPAIRCRCGTTTCKLFTTNGKYCSGHYLQNIDNQPYHNTTRVFRPHQNIRKTLVVFLTISKSRTYQNTPLLHLPLDPPPPASTTFRRWGTSVPATTAANCGKRYNDIIATDRARYYSTSIPATARR